MPMRAEDQKAVRTGEVEQHAGGRTRLRGAHDVDAGWEIDAGECAVEESHGGVTRRLLTDLRGW